MSRLLVSFHDFFSFCLILIAILFIAVSVSEAQIVEEGWKGILVFKTDKATVEKLLGKPEINSDGYFNYSSDEAFVQVDFSDEPCSERPYGRGRYNVPKDRVIGYHVILRKAVLFSSLNFDRAKFYRDTSGDVLNTVYYHRTEGGISIGGKIDVITNLEYAGVIYYDASKSEKSGYSCKSLK